MLKSPRHISFLLTLTLGLTFSTVSAFSAEMAQGTVYHDTNHNGKRDAGERGIRHIGVSNGLDIVQTDRQGRYRLPVEDDTILFVIKPAHYSLPVNANMIPQFFYVHKPAGSPDLKFSGVAPTGPLPDSIDFPLYRQKEPAKFKALFFGDTQPDRQEEVDYLAHDIVEELVGTKAAFGLTLGDIVGDNLDLMKGVNRAIGVLGVPWFYVQGNHDINQDAKDDAYAAETFNRLYGPNVYAFNYGKVHFLVLDSVEWEGNKYHGELGKDQLAFVRNDLALVPKDRLVVLTMHIPLVDVNDRKELFALLEDRPHTFSISGHWHGMEHFYIGEDEGWPQEKDHHHYVAGATCGAWWTGNKDEVNLPHATMMDGTPNGYSMAEFNGNQYTFEFKAARRPADYQMNIFTPESVQWAAAAETQVVVNVFDGSERSSVEMRVGESGPWTPMTQTKMKDPYVEIFKKLSDNGDSKSANWVNPADSPHIWTGQLPVPGQRPESAILLLQVRTTDQYGHTHQDHRTVRVE
jgi:hypothetical protein